MGGCGRVCDGVVARGANALAGGPTRSPTGAPVVKPGAAGNGKRGRMNWGPVGSTWGELSDGAVATFAGPKRSILGAAGAAVGSFGAASSAEIGVACVDAASGVAGCDIAGSGAAGCDIEGSGAAASGVAASGAAGSGCAVGGAAGGGVAAATDSGLAAAGVLGLGVGLGDGLTTATSAAGVDFGVGLTAGVLVAVWRRDDDSGWSVKRATLGPESDGGADFGAVFGVVFEETFVGAGAGLMVRRATRGTNSSSSRGAD